MRRFQSSIFKPKLRIFLKISSNINDNVFDIG